MKMRGGSLIQPETDTSVSPVFVVHLTVILFCVLRINQHLCSTMKTANVCGVGVPGVDVAAAEVSFLTRLQSRLLFSDASVQVLEVSFSARPPSGRIVSAVGMFFCAQSSVLLSGSFLIVSAPMWFASPEAAVSLGFSLCCTSGTFGPHGSKLLSQSTGP